MAAKSRAKMCYYNLGSYLGARSWGEERGGAWPGTAGHGVAGQGEERGGARLGQAGHGKAGVVAPIQGWFLDRRFLLLIHWGK